MAGSRVRMEIPPWAIGVAVVVGVALIAFIAWHALAGPTDGPAKEVHAGMYDFRKEAASGNLGGGLDLSKGFIVAVDVAPVVPLAVGHVVAADQCDIGVERAEIRSRQRD